jgi:hypothetical protein
MYLFSLDMCVIHLMNAATVCNREYPYAFYVAESPYAYGESLYAYWDSFFGQPSSLE